jgi:hypothetical protein
VRRAAEALVAVAALSSAGPAGAGLPRAAVLVPGRSLGGVRLGATQTTVTRTWGSGHGVCRGCRDRTWYFNYRAFDPQGAGVSFRRGRVVSVFTLWSPPGWRTSKGLQLGEDAARITALYGPLLRRDCVGYSALALRTGSSVTCFYVVNDRLWGFALRRPGIPLCR